MHTNEDRFWNKVFIPPDKDQCWEWTAGLYPAGYGKFKYYKKHCGSHRLSWAFAFGEVPDGLCVLHKCDNRKCVNPSHLFLGTRTDNARDRDLKGRGGFASGENAGASKLTDHQVHLIRRLRSEIGLTQTLIGKLFGITQSSVSNIIRGKSWVRSHSVI